MDLFGLLHKYLWRRFVVLIAVCLLDWWDLCVHGCLQLLQPLDGKILPGWQCWWSWHMCIIVYCYPQWLYSVYVQLICSFSVDWLQRKCTVGMKNSTFVVFNCPFPFMQCEGFQWFHVFTHFCTLGLPYDVYMTFTKFSSSFYLQVFFSVAAFFFPLHTFCYSETLWPDTLSWCTPRHTLFDFY